MTYLYNYRSTKDVEKKDNNDDENGKDNNDDNANDDDSVDESQMWQWLVPALNYRWLLHC